MFILETERLILRDFKKADLPAYIELRNDVKFRRFYSESDVTREKSISLVEMFIAQSKEQPRTQYQLAITNKNRDLMGSCGIRIEGENTASIGCELGRKWQTSGYAYEAASTMINYAFSELAIQRVYAETISQNKAAVKLCQMLGMHVDAELKNNKNFQGRLWDTMILGILKQDSIMTTPQ